MMANIRIILCQYSLIRCTVQSLTDQATLFCDWKHSNGAASHHMSVAASQQPSPRAQKQPAGAENIMAENRVAEPVFFFFSFACQSIPVPLHQSAPTRKTLKGKTRLTCQLNAEGFQFKQMERYDRFRSESAPLLHWPFYIINVWTCNTTHQSSSRKDLASGQD